MVMMLPHRSIELLQKRYSLCDCQGPLTLIYYLVNKKTKEQRLLHVTCEGHEYGLSFCRGYGMECIMGVGCTCQTIDKNQTIKV